VCALCSCVTQKGAGGLNERGLIDAVCSICFEFDINSQLVILYYLCELVYYLMTNWVSN